METKLTEQDVIARFREAVITLRRLPQVKVRGYFNSWPEIIYTEREVMRMDRKTRMWPATADAIARMEKTILWLNLIAEINDRKIVWMRAENIPWEIICKRFEISRGYAFKKWKNAIHTICTLEHI